MSDLILRMDAVQACQVGPSDEWSRDTKSGYNQAATDCAMNILRIPAVTVQAQIDAAVKAEREWWITSLAQIKHQVEFYTRRTDLFRKGDQP